MKSMLVTCAAILFLTLATPPIARAAEKYDPAALAKTIAPYLDEGTLFVAHADMTRIDLMPAVTRVKELFPRIGTPAEQAAAMADVDGAVAAAQKWIADFTKAGGRDIFAVLSMSDFPNSPIVLVVPVEKGADAQAIIKLLGPPDGANPADPADATATAQLRGNVILWARKPTLDRLAALKPTPYPDLPKIFEAAGDTAIQALYVPSADTRKVLAEMLPDAQQGPFAGAGASISRQLLWTAQGMDLAPKLNFTVVMQTPDAASAAALSDTINKGIDLGKQMMLREMKRFPEAARMIGDADALAKAFTPTIAGDRLTLNLDTDNALKLSGIILPAMAKAREQSLRMRSLSNLKQITMACILYANEHKNQFPPDLETVQKTNELPAEILRNPRVPNKPIGYVYLQPKGNAPPADQIVAYEAFGQPLPSSLAASFADGHAEIMDYPRFAKALAESKARNDAK
jgi:hypothetical protein